MRWKLILLALVAILPIFFIAVNVQAVPGQAQAPSTLEHVTLPQPLPKAITGQQQPLLVLARSTVEDDNLKTTANWYEHLEGEEVERLSVALHVHPESHVLELHASSQTPLGSFTCALALATHNSNTVVAVEEDAGAAKRLRTSIQSSFCKAHVHVGSLDRSSASSSTIAELQDDYGLEFDTIVAHCESCLVSLLMASSDVLARVVSLLVCKDQNASPGTSSIEHLLLDAGFSEAAPMLFGTRQPSAYSVFEHTGRKGEFLRARSQPPARDLGVFTTRYTENERCEMLGGASPLDNPDKLLRKEFRYEGHQRGQWPLITAIPPAWSGDFKDKKRKKIFFAKERYEHRIILHFVHPDAKVLEVGVRYGTSSCVLALATRNSGKVVSIEADDTVLEQLKANVQQHQCAVQVYHGLLSKETHMKAGKLAGSEYTTMFEPVPEDIAAVMAEADRVPSISFQELQEKYNIEFDTLLVDCEGCFENMLAEFPNMLDQVSTLMLEADYGMEWQPGGYANYSRVLATLKSLGFLQVLDGCGMNMFLTNSIPYWVFIHPARNHWSRRVWNHIPW